MSQRILDVSRQQTQALEVREAMPGDVQKRWRKSMQSRLRQTLIRRFDVLDRRDVATSRLLSVPLVHRVGKSSR